LQMSTKREGRFRCAQTVLDINCEMLSSDLSIPWNVTPQFPHCDMWGVACRANSEIGH
jgi:hypothetical protein